MNKKQLKQTIKDAKAVFAYINLNGSGGYMQVAKRDVLSHINNSEDNDALRDAFESMNVNDNGNVYLN